MKNFQEVESEGANALASQNIYLTRLNKLKQIDQFYLDVDADHISQFDKPLYNQIIYYPSDMFPFLDRAATSLYREFFFNSDLIENTQPPIVHVRLNHLRTQSRMRDLNPSDINHLISIRGIVIRCSDIQPEMNEAHFRCVNCKKTEAIANEGGRIQEPNDCSSCKTKNSFEIIHNLCFFSDRQYIKLQETPEIVPDGETPQTVTLVVHDELVDSVKPGDRVEITGIFRAQPLKVTANHRTLRSVFNTYIDVISFDLTSKQRFLTPEDQKEQDDITDDLKNEITELSKRPDIYELLMESMAPSIWENDDVKKGILCQLFGGCKKEFSQTGKGRFR